MGITSYNPKRLYLPEGSGVKHLSFLKIAHCESC
jgi:hypothetical protein